MFKKYAFIYIDADDAESMGAVLNDELERLDTADVAEIVTPYEVVTMTEVDGDYTVLVAATVDNE